MRWQPLVSFLAATIATLGCGAGVEDIYETGTGGGGGGTTDTTTIIAADIPYGTTSGAGTGPGTGGAGGKSGMGGGAGSEGVGGAGGNDPTGMGGGSYACSDPGEPRTFYLSSDDSSSMGSAALAREYLRNGTAPPPALIRTYEFLNYYRVRYPQSSSTQLTAHVHFAPGPEDKKYRLQIGVQAFDVVRPPLSLTFVVDTSGSLVGEGMARERAAISAIAKNLKTGDLVNFVTWSNQDAELLASHEISGPDDGVLLGIVDELIPGGGSDLHAGLVHGYALAKQTDTPGRLSRVVLISDGGANVGVVDRDRIAFEAKNGDDLGIYLIGIGLGPAVGYTDTLMNLVTDQGRGSYVYLDSTDEASAVLDKRFDEVMDIAARSVRVKLTLPSYLDITNFFGEEYSQDAEQIEPQHIAPGDSMIFNQRLGVQSGQALCGLDSIHVHVDWFDPALHQLPGPNFSDEDHTIDSLSGEAWQLLKAEAIITYAEALKSRLKGDFQTASTAIDRARKDPALIAEDPYKSELDEIATLLASFPPADVME